MPVVGTNQNNMLHNQITYDRKYKQYREVEDLEKVLKTQIKQTIDPDFLVAFQHRTTGLLQGDISSILQSLADDYGVLDPALVRKAETDLWVSTYSIQDSLVKLVNPIEELSKMGAAAKIPYTSDQLINIAIESIKRSGDLVKGLEDWTKLPAAQKTWPNLIKHFTSARNLLKRTRGPTLRSTTYHHANIMQEQIMEAVNGMKQEFLGAVTDLSQRVELSTPTHKEVANAARQVTPESRDVVNIEILKLLKDIRKDLNNNPNPRKPKRRKTSCYCWTHGAGNHGSADCKTPARGHRDEATFHNKLGGSKRFCHANTKKDTDNKDRE